MQAAARELLEETGVVVAPEALVGPVLRRTAVFDFFRRTVRQDEEFFLARALGRVALTRSGWTTVEQAFMDEVRWFHLDELEQVEEEVFPASLVDEVRVLLDGWDGVTREVPDGP